MYRRGLLSIFMVLTILIPSISFSQTSEIKDYTVVSGDTLWSISGKELGDPFLWPKIWQENPTISNPDRLYPGQKIRIPLRYAQKEGPEPGVPEAPQKGELPKKAKEGEKAPPVLVSLRPLIDNNVLIASGFIAETIAVAGNVAGAPDRILFGNDDIVFVNIDKPANVGERFYIIRDRGVIMHPVTNKKIGHLVEMVGVTEVIRLENGDTLAKITKMFNDIHPGDILMPYFEINAPLTTGEFRKPEIAGYVVASRYEHLGNAKLNIVYIDRGLKDGLEIGDIVKTIDIVDGHKIATGVIQVINCQSNTSTAVVLENYSGPIVVGNPITKLD